MLHLAWPTTSSQTNGTNTEDKTMIATWSMHAVLKFLQGSRRDHRCTCCYAFIQWSSDRLRVVCQAVIQNTTVH